MIPLDFPSTYSGDDPSAAGEPSGASVASSSLSGLRLERYLAEEHCHERLSLGVPTLGSNKATVKKYLDEIIHNIEGNEASQAGATCGTTTDCDERGSRRSTTSSISTSSAESSELAEAHNTNDAQKSSDLIPSLAGLGGTDVARFKPEQAPADSESHHDGPDVDEGLETGRILMYVIGRLRDSPSVTNGQAVGATEREAMRAMTGGAWGSDRASEGTFAGEGGGRSCTRARQSDATASRLPCEMSC